jgi:hypothetical protein
MITTPARRQMVVRFERRCTAMGFLDKVKETTAQATAAAKDAATKGQAKLDTMQAKKAADAMLRDLGVAAYAEQTGRGTAESQAGAGRLVAALQQHEATNGAIALTFESPAAADPAAAAGVPQAADPTQPAPAPPQGVPQSAPMPPPAATPVDAPMPPPTGQSV